MIVGRGDIASILNDREGAIFFASGVSNSTETTQSEYWREMQLLDKQDKNKCLFYFSSISADAQPTHHHAQDDQTPTGGHQDCLPITVALEMIVTPHHSNDHQCTQFHCGYVRLCSDKLVRVFSA